MIAVYFFLIFFSFFTLQAQHKQTPRKSPAVSIPGIKSPYSSSPSPTSWESDLGKTPSSWGSVNNDGNLTDDLREMKSSTDFEESSLRFISPVQSPRGDKQAEHISQQSCCTKFFRSLFCCPTQKKSKEEAIETKQPSCCTKLFCCLWCCCCKKKPASFYETIS